MHGTGNRIHRFKGKKYLILNLTVMYFIAAVFVLIPGCISPRGYIGSLAFIISAAFIYFATKDLYCLSFYFVLLLINSSLAELPIIGTTITLTSVIYGFFILMTIVCLMRKSEIKKMAIPPWFFALWILYRIFIDTHFGQGFGYSLWNSTPIYICFVIQALILMRPKYKNHLISCLMASLIIMCMTGYIEFILGRTFFYSLWKGQSYRFGIVRIGSTVADPNFLCLIEVTLLFVLRSKAFNDLYDYKVMKIIKTLVIVQIILTFSRTGILALIAGYSIESLCSKKKWMLSLIPCIVIGLSIVPSLFNMVLNLDVNSTVSRFRVVEAALYMWKKSPLIGNGSGAFYQQSFSLIGSQLSTMNLYVEQLVSYGLIGLGFYFIYCYLLLKKSALLVITGNLFQKGFIPEFIAAVFTWIIMSATLDTFSKVVFWILPSIELVLFQAMNEKRNDVLTYEYLLSMQNCSRILDNGEG